MMSAQSWGGVLEPLRFLSVLTSFVNLALSCGSVAEEVTDMLRSCGEEERHVSERMASVMMDR